MKRNAVENLIEWRENGTMVPFLLVGTKGTGKTYLAMEFAAAYYPQYLYVNFELNSAATEFFESDLSRGASVAETIAAYFQMDEIYLSELAVILDEVSFCKPLWEALLQKSVFPATPVIAISSILPEKDVKEYFCVCHLFPLGFDEFLSAVRSDWYIDIIQGHYQNLKPVPDIVHQELLALFEEYLVVGGMPAAVNEYISSKSVYNIGEVHCMVKQRMRALMETKYDEKEAGKAEQVIAVLPEQLKKENKKFRFNLIRKGVTYALYKDSIDALEQCGLILRLNEKSRETHFKLYLPDVGMLSSSLAGIETEEARKAILENYIMQTFVAGADFELHFWESEAQAKVDFLLTKKEDTTPVELRISTNGKSKSVASYQASMGEKEKKYYRFGFENFYSTPVLIQVPYYAAFCIK